MGGTLSVTLLKQKTNRLGSVQNLDVYINWIHQGNIVVYPTETIYGLGADIWNDDAVRMIYTMKQRPQSQPVSIAAASLDDVRELVHIDKTVQKIADLFLPGPLTIVLKKKTKHLDTLTGGGKTIGIRIPDHPIAHDLLSLFGPLTSTSANIHSQPVPETISDIARQLKDHSDILKYIDDGQCSGKPSTILDFTTSAPKILREGAITRKTIWDAITNG